jgi:pimeloyl-ACP methyl ester carboxylesterase
MAEDWSRATTPDGQEFVYADSGSGPLVVLYHGFPDTPDAWDGIAGRLAAAGYRAVRPYLRGYHPDTIVPGRPYDGVSNGQDVIRFLDALGERDAFLVGHDWGATCVYSATAQAPERVRGICPIAIPHTTLLERNLSTLIGVRHFFALKLPWAESFVRRGNFAYLDKLYRRWAPNWSGPARDESLAKVKACFSDDRCLTGAIDWYRGFSFTPVPELLTVPDVRGLAVGGTVDIAPAESMGPTAAALAEGSEVMIAEGAGHWPHREAESEFTERLIAFLGAG